VAFVEIWGYGGSLGRDGKSEQLPFAVFRYGRLSSGFDVRCIVIVTTETCPVDIEGIYYEVAIVDVE
jgi:hypothetical protein